MRVKYVCVGSNRPDEWVAQQALGDTEVVDSLSDAEQRCDHDHPAHASLEERRRALMHQRRPGVYKYRT